MEASPLSLPVYPRRRVGVTLLPTRRAGGSLGELLIIVVLEDINQQKRTLKEHFFVTLSSQTSAARRLWYEKHLVAQMGLI